MSDRMDEANACLGRLESEIEGIRQDRERRKALIARKP